MSKWEEKRGTKTESNIAMLWLEALTRGTTQPLQHGNGLGITITNRVPFGR